MAYPSPVGFGSPVTPRAFEPPHGEFNCASPPPPVLNVWPIS